MIETHHRPSHKSLGPVAGLKFLSVRTDRLDLGGSANLNKQIRLALRQFRSGVSTIARIFVRCQFEGIVKFHLNLRRHRGF